MTKITAVILAGGLGTRLSDVSFGRPKAVMPIKGKPIIERIIERLPRAFFSDVVLSVGHRSEVLKNHLDTLKLPFRLTYVNDERLIGTSNAVKSTLSFIDSKHVLILNGDTLCDVCLSGYAGDYISRSVQMMSIGFLSTDPRFGEVPLKFYDGREMEGRGTLRNAGYYLTSLDTLEDLFKNRAIPSGEGFEASWFDDIHKTRSISLIPSDRFIDIGTVSDYGLSQSLDWIN